MAKGSGASRFRYVSFLTAITFLSSMLTSPSTYADTYVVRKQNTLSQIVWERMGSPLYGRNNYLEQTVKLNPQIKDPNFIEPGQLVHFPPRMLGRPNTAATEPDPSSLEKVPEPIATETPSELIVATPIPTPTSTAAPPSETPTSSTDETSWLEFRFTGDLRGINSTLKSNTGQGTLGSKFNFGGKIEWKKTWNSQWGTLVAIELKNEEYKPPVGILLNSPKKTIVDFEFGPTLKLSASTEIRALVASHERNFFMANSITTIDITQVRSFGPKIELVWKMIDDPYFSSELKPSIDMTLARDAANYRFQSGLGYQLDLAFLIRATSDLKFMFGAFGRLESQDEASSEFKSNLVGGFIGLRKFLQ